MENMIRTFQFFIRHDEESLKIAEKIRRLNSNIQSPLVEAEDGDLVIAIGGDGTFIDAVTSTQFSKKKIYTGIHAGTLGFLQDLSYDDIHFFVQYINLKQELKVRKVYISLVKIFLRNNTVLEYFSLNEVLVVGVPYSKISFEQYVNDELLQKVSGNGIVIATSTGDTAYSLNASGAIDFSRNFQLVCTLETPIKNAAFENFITNPIICSKVKLVLKPADNISIIIDGIAKDIEGKLIESVEVSMTDDSNYINKLDLVDYSKVRVVRNKILGY